MPPEKVISPAATENNPPAPATSATSPVKETPAKEPDKPIVKDDAENTRKQELKDSLAKFKTRSEDKEPPPDKTPDKDTTPLKYKFGDVELDEAEAKIIAKVMKKDKLDDAAKDWSDNLNWKAKNAEEGRKLNLARAESEEKIRQATEIKENYVTSLQRVRDDVLKETKINQTYDEKIKAVYAEIKAKREATDFDDPLSVADFEDFQIDKTTDIADLKTQRRQELAEHKATMEKVEREETERKDQNEKLKIVELARTFPDRFNDIEYFNQVENFNKFRASDAFKALTLEQQQQSLNNYPLVKDITILDKYAQEHKQTSYVEAYRIYLMEAAIAQFQVEQKEWEKKLIDAEKTGYDKAIAEIKGNGKSFSELDKDKPPIVTNPEDMTEKYRKSTLKTLLNKFTT